MKPVDKTWRIESKRNFFKYWFNRHPDLVFLKGCILVAAVGAYQIVKEHQEKSPFNYRYTYTIWRDDDPRAIRMLDRMEKYNFKPLRRID